MDSAQTRDACTDALARAVGSAADEPRDMALASTSVCEDDEVHISVIVQYFRRPSIVRTLAARIRAAAAALGRRKVRVEVLVNLDSQGAVALWYSALVGRRGGGGDGDKPTGYLVESGNVHEIRAYNRLVRMSRGDVSVLLQDDDLPPSRPSWAESAWKLLRARADVGLLGGKTGTVRGGKYSGKYSPSLGRKLANRLSLPASARDPSTRLPLFFTTLVNMAPFAFRRTDYLSLGGFHANYGDNDVVELACARCGGHARAG